MVIAPGAFQAAGQSLCFALYPFSFRHLCVNARRRKKTSIKTKHLISWPLGQVVKTSPFHGGNMGSNPVGVTTSWGYSSAGRARALQARGHRFEPCCPHQKEHANTACFFMLFRPRIVALQLRTFSVPLCPGHTARFAFVSLLTRFAVIRALLFPPHDNHPHLSHLQERMFYFYHAFCSLKNEQPRTTNHAFLDMSFLAPFFQFVLKNVFYMI